MADNTNYLEVLNSLLGTGMSGSGSARDSIAGLANGQGRVTGPATQAASKQQPMVWMGKRTQESVWQPAGRPTKGKTVRTPVSIDDALGQPWFWSEKKRQEMYRKASEATGKEINNVNDFMSVWNTVVGLAADSWNATGGRAPKTPYDILDMMKREVSVSGAASGAAGGDPRFANGPVTTTSRVSSVNRLSDGSAWQLLKSTAQNALGREPTHEEMRSFASRVNQIASENPDITTTTTTVDENGNSTSKSSNKPGAQMADYQTAAEEDTDTAEAGAYQAATTYYQAMLQGLESVV